MAPLPLVSASAASLLLARAALAATLWSSPDALSTSVPPACRAVLARDIACQGPLMTPAQTEGDGALVGQLASQYCTPECHASLQAFQAAVDEHCGSTVYRMYQNDPLEQSAAALVAGLLWAYNLSCIQDSSGFGLADLYSGKEPPCSDSALKYAAVMAGSQWGPGRVDPDSFSSLLASCHADASSYPSQASQTTTPTTSAISTTMPAVSPTCLGNRHIVQTGESCESISKDASMATDRMISLNHLDYNCTTLTVGRPLCLQDTCATQTVLPNDTCSSIMRGKDFAKIHLISWNPTIHHDCGNLDSMVGRSICVSPPGGGSILAKREAPLPPHPILAASMFSSWVPVAASDSDANFKTSLYTPTIKPDAPPVTQTNSYNATRATLIAKRTRHCWISDELWDGGFNRHDLPQACQPLLDEHCFPRPEAPVPASPARIPPECIPTFTRTPVPPAPTDGADGCKKQYGSPRRRQLHAPRYCVE